MPQKTETISVAGYTEDNIQAIAYGALESLSWTIKYAIEKQIIAYTPRSWNKYDHEILVEIAGESLTITSKHIHGEVADLPGRNKKFISAFLQAFEATKSTATEDQLSGWKEKITALHGSTLETAQKAMKEAEEVDKVMKLSGSNMYVTYGIIAVNVVVFILMVMGGVDIIQPTGLDIIKWGGDYAPFTFSGDWWRVISCMFVHIGIIHLLFNMYALYMIGVYLEPMLGKSRYIGAYLATGILSSLASLWWHKDPIASAGASGAIFGMYGVFLALLSTKLIPKQVRDQLLKSIGIFIGYNLLYGMKSGVDNAAHLGGLISGFIVGYVFYMGWKKADAKKNAAIAVSVVVAAAAICYAYIGSNKIGQQERVETKHAIQGASYKDYDKYLEDVDSFTKTEEKALAPLSDGSLNEENRSRTLDSVSLPEWDNAAVLIEKIKSYELPEMEKKRVELMEEYIALRREEISAIRNLFNEKSEQNQDALREVSVKISNLYSRLENLQ